MTNDQIKAIKAKLPKGSRSEIKEATGLTLGYIDKVLAGSRFNKDVFHIAFDIIGNLEADKKSVDERFNELFNEDQNQ